MFPHTNSIKRQRLILLPIFAMLVLLLNGCATVPVTGRSQLLLMPESELDAMSSKEYSQFLATHRLSHNRREVEMVRRVGWRIAHAVERYLAQHGQSNLIRGYKWEFNLVEGKEINAWCMPGGKVVVYTGLLPIARNDAGLAVVLGHEIAHAIARHANERISQQLALQIGGSALSSALGTSGSATNTVFRDLYGLGANLGVLLPYSRLQETEADHLGLIFMAMAGYDPREAVNFWERMMKTKKAGGAPPELLSTHPSDRARIEQIRKFLPEALRYYRKAGYANK